MSDVKYKRHFFRSALVLSDLAGVRTQDPLIKSQVLYQLSYEIKKKASFYELLFPKALQRYTLFYIFQPLFIFF